jgi:hypothetical protein
MVPVPRFGTTTIVIGDGEVPVPITVFTIGSGAMNILMEGEKVVS